MSNNSGDVIKGSPRLEMGLTSPDDVATLTRVSFMIVSTSRSMASTVSIAADFPVPGLRTDMV